MCSVIWGVLWALQDAKLAREMQALFASPYLRVNTTTDVTGVEICGGAQERAGPSGGHCGGA